MTTHTCPRCRASLPAPRSRLLIALVLLFAYALTFAFGVALSCLGPAGIGVLPIYVLGAIGLITSAHTFADGVVECEGCGAIVEADDRSALVAQRAQSASSTQVYT